MKDWAFVTGFLIFALFLTINSWDYPSVSALYPRLLLVCGFILSCIKIIAKLRAKNKDELIEGGDSTAERENKNPINMWIYFAASILYMLLIPILGFVTATILCLFVLLIMFGIKIRIAIGIALGTSLAFYLIFVLFLGIPLPKGIIDALLL